MKKEKKLILRLGGIAKDPYIFTMVLAGKVSINMAEQILTKRERSLKERLAIKGNNLF